MDLQVECGVSHDKKQGSHGKAGQAVGTVGAVVPLKQLMTCSRSSVVRSCKFFKSNGTVVTISDQLHTGWGGQVSANDHRAACSPLRSQLDCSKGQKSFQRNGPSTYAVRGWLPNRARSQKQAIRSNAEGMPAHWALRSPAGSFEEEGRVKDPRIPTGWPLPRAWLD